LALARLTLDPGNLLLLDEPTNHLDLPTREALEDALAGFGGTLVFVSHDRYFINKVATRVAAFTEGRLAFYRGGNDDYRAALKGAVPAGEPVRADSRPRSRIPEAREREPERSRAAPPPEGSESRSPRPPASTGSEASEGAGASRREQRRLDAEA